MPNLSEQNISPLSLIKTIQLVATLAVKDLIFDKKIALCIIFSLVSVIAPLMLLFGLKNGIVTQLQTKLLNDPRNIEIIVLGNKNHPDHFIDEISKRPDVGFVIPLTRSLNAQADLLNTKEFFAENIEMIPTSKGDPLLGDLAQDLKPDEIILTSNVAKKINIGVGDEITVLVSRKYENQFEKGKRSVKVVAILETAYFTRPAAFISLSLLIDMENYRDGFFVPELSATTGSQPKDRTHFAKFRLYAKSVDDVKGLSHWLAENNIETSTRLGEIENVKAVNYVLGFIFAVIAWITFIGCVASLLGAFLANIDRKRKDMAVMRLIGFRKRSVASYIILQAIIMTAIAYVIACSLYKIGSTVFNQALGSALPANQFATFLTFKHFSIAFVLAFSIAMIVAAIGAFRAVKIDPAESLREI